MGKHADLIDFHAHILPGADHGSRSLETSQSQLRLLWEAGVGRVCATPHFYPNEISVDGFLKRREEAVNELLRLRGQNLPQVCLGAEVLVCPGLERMPGLEKLCIDGTKVILLEMPFFKWSDALFETVYNISRSGYTVVMAHIGRYPYSQAHRLVFDTGVSVQLNGENVATIRGRRRVRTWLSEGMVCAFGSDIHGASAKHVKGLASLNSYAGEYARSVYEKSDELLDGARYITFDK